MAGNVWEWTESLYDDRSDYRVLRGGSWDNYHGVAACGYREFIYPEDRVDLIGFRCARI